MNKDQIMPHIERGLKIYESINLDGESPLAIGVFVAFILKRVERAFAVQDPAQAAPMIAKLMAMATAAAGDGEDLEELHRVPVTNEQWQEVLGKLNVAVGLGMPDTTPENAASLRDTLNGIDESVRRARRLLRPFLKPVPPAAAEPILKCSCGYHGSISDYAAPCPRCGSEAGALTGAVPAVNWVRLKKGNDWGAVYFAIEPYRNDDYGNRYADSTRAIRLNEGEPVTVRMPNGEVHNAKITLMIERERVGDMGHSYDAESKVPHVAFAAWGASPRVRIDEVEVDEAWARARGAQ